MPTRDLRPHRMRACALVLGAALAATAALVAAAPAAPASGRSSVVVLDGRTAETAVLPNDRFTVADRTQLTGRRVALPVPRCTTATLSTCAAVRLLDTLDGFDLQPRAFIPFSGAIDVRSVTPRTVYVEGPDGRVGFQQLTWFPREHVLAATLRAQLREGTRYAVVVTRDVRDAAGRRIARGARVRFTTMSATTELDRMRRALDDGSAYRQAGIASRDVSFTQGPLTTVFPPTSTITRLDQVAVDPTTPLASSSVLVSSAAGVGCYAFGSLETPQFVRADATIPPTPSRRTPRALGKARIGFAMVVPAGTPPANGWPTAVYGPGFTRSYFDLFLTADANAAAGIATVATDPLGHGFGPRSQVQVQTPTGTSTFLSYGRGRDLDGDGEIGDAEGSQPTKRVTLRHGRVVREVPSPDALHGLRGGLEQTTVDDMALVRAIEHGVTVPSCGAGDARLSRTGVEYYGLSFGGIYGTMLMGTDPRVRRGLLNVGGGPVVDIARLSGFRDLLADTLRVSRPRLTNGGPGLNGFTEDIPDPYDAPVTRPHAGSLALQRYLAYATWYERPGGPEPYAPLERLRPRYGAKEVAYQIAYGDHTVPNITGGNIIRAGDLWDRLTYYRNDKTPTNGSDPHGFLEDPRLAGREGAEAQLTTFLSTGQIVDPDGSGPVFEFPIANRDDLQCLHYPNPQTGQSAYPPAAAGECGPRPAAQG